MSMFILAIIFMLWIFFYCSSMYCYFHWKGIYTYTKVPSADQLMSAGYALDNTRIWKLRNGTPYKEFQSILVYRRARSEQEYLQQIADRRKSKRERRFI